MAFIKALKILAILAGILNLPLILFGYGIFTTTAFFWFALQMNKVTDGTYDESSASMKQKFAVYSSVIFAGLASFFDIFALGAIAHIDTTGTAAAPTLFTGAVGCAALSIVAAWTIHTHAK